MTASKKSIGLMLGKTTTLHVRHTFGTFLCRHCTTTTWNSLVSHYGVMWTQKDDFVSLCCLNIILLDIYTCIHVNQEICYLSFPLPERMFVDSCKVVLTLEFAVYIPKCSHSWNLAASSPFTWYCLFFSILLNEFWKCRRILTFDISGSLSVVNYICIVGQ